MKNFFDNDYSLNYGSSYINSKDVEQNSPRFVIESSCYVFDYNSNKTEEYYQCCNCMKENLYAERRLFAKIKTINCVFTPVFGIYNSVIFRGFSRISKEIRKTENMWGGVNFCLEKFKIKKIDSFQDLKNVLKNNEVLNGRTEVVSKNRKVIIEYPIKTINMDKVGNRWQVDTGPVIFPVFSSINNVEDWANSLSLSYIAFCTKEWSDFLVYNSFKKYDDGRKNKYHFYNYSKHERVINVTNLLFTKQESKKGT